MCLRYHSFVFPLLFGGLLLIPAMAQSQPDPFGMLDLPREFKSRRVSVQSFLQAGEDQEILNLEGEGCIRHIWTTFNRAYADTGLGQDLILRIYVDGRETPNAEVPIAPFFAHFESRAPGVIEAPVMQVTPRGGMNAYFPIPYGDGITMTITNETGEALDYYFQADYHEYATGSLKEERRFAAAFRRTYPAERWGDPYFVGRGHGKGFLAGVALGMRVSDRADGWYHGGGDLILLDGGSDTPGVISGIGGEDFFGTAYGLSEYTNGPIGSPYYEYLSPKPPFEQYEGKPELFKQALVETDITNPYLIFSAYRFFIPDVIAFEEDFALYFGSMRNEMVSMIYWYQDEPVQPFFKLPPRSDRHAGTEISAEEYDIAGSDELVWDICGPFPAATRAEFEKREFPEERIDYSESRPANFGLYAFAKEKQRGETDTRWTQDIKAINGFVNMRGHYHTKLPTNFAFPKDTAAYAYTTIESAEEEDVTLHIGHDDWLRVWINGERVYDGEARTGFGSSQIRVGLEEGKNQILLKSANKENSNQRAWVFHFRIDK